MKRIVAVVVMFTLTACATVQHGPVQRIHVDSEPQGAVVRTADCGPGSTKEAVTPAVVWVSRRAERCALRFTSQGHYAETVMLTRKVADEFLENLDIAAEICCEGSGDFLGWLFVGGLFAGTGFAVDGATGAMYEQQPSEVFVELEPASEQR